MGLLRPPLHPHPPTCFSLRASWLQARRARVLWSLHRSSLGSCINDSASRSSTRGDITPVRHGRRERPVAGTCSGRWWTCKETIVAKLAPAALSIGRFPDHGQSSSSLSPTDMAALSDLKWGRLGLMDVDRCAAHAVHALVYRQSFAIPGMGNQLTYLASRVLPRSLVNRIAALPYRRP